MAKLVYPEEGVPDKILRHRRKVRENNREKPEYFAAYYEANKDRLKQQQRQWRERNRDRFLAQKKAWKKANNEKERAYMAKRRALAICSAKHYSGDDVFDLLKIQRGKCAYCKRGISKKYHVDHITPLALQGTNARSNIQLLCPPCNMRKGASDPIDFAQKIGLLI
jgi:5-methylcytosine-specific restriction endonuclease McrA